MVFTLLTLAAQQATVTGVVRDGTTLEPIAFAEVAVSPAGATVRSAAGLSDRFGAFVIPNAPGGPARIEAGAFGYSEWARHFEELPAGPLEILLAPAPIALDPLGVEAAGRKGDPISVSRDAFVVDPAMIRAVPTVLETDVLRVMAVSPSASAPSDFVSVPYVRGGASEGTPVLLDGVRLFNPFHLGGFFSAVNPEAVDHAALLPGSGAGSQHVGSLSGAIEIATRDGSRDGHRVTGAVGLASSRLAVEGPVGGGTSYLVDGRHTYVYLLAKAMGGDFPYSFSDAHAKITHDFGGLRRLSVTGYVNSEGMEYDDHWDDGRTDFGWGSSAVAAHYRDRLAGGAVLDVTIGRSRFDNDLLEFDRDIRFQVDTAVFGRGHMREDRVDVRTAWHLSRGTLTAGAQAIRLEGDHRYSRSYAGDYASLFIPAPLTLRSRRWRIGVFANVDAPLGRSWRTRAGVRADRFAGLVNTFAPFAELSYAGPWWEARIGAARSHQAMASLRNEEALGAILLAYDLLAPVRNGPVPRNTEVTAGWEGSRGDWRLRLDGYARRMENIRLPVLGENPVQDEAALGDPSLRVAGSGTAAGIEASCSWVRGPVSAVGGYRWGRAWRKVEDMTYVPRFHRDHELELGAALETGRSNWSARFSLRSGQPFTPALAVVPVGDPDLGNEYGGAWVVFHGEHNSGRLPPYLRLDLGWRRTRQRSRAGGRFATPFVSVTNLLSAPNVAGGWAEVYPDLEGREVKVYREYFPQMPMLVFFGLEFGF